MRETELLIVDSSVVLTDLYLFVVVVVFFFVCRFTPVPDSVISRNLNAGYASSSIDPNTGLTSVFPGDMTPGFATPAGDIDMKKIGEARNTLMSIKLSQVCF